MNVIEFLRLANGEHPGPIRVGRINSRISSIIGARTPMVMLSRATAEKQFSRHGDLRISEYAGIPYILENGEVYNDKIGSVILVLDCRKTFGYHVKASIKVARGGEEVYLTSLHKLRPRDVERIRKRFGKVLPEIRKAQLI